MADLNALKSQFMSLQKQQSSFKLSERTVVEIINKISNRGKIKLLHTVTGKEYVVNEKVNKEILDEIKKLKKTSIIEISKRLELPTSVIEKKVNEIIPKNKSLTLIDQKIITNDFLNTITLEIKNTLNHFSSASIADLSEQYELPIEFLKKFLQDKIDSNEIPNAKLYHTRLITNYYIEIQKKKIRPALIASITPIHISTLISKYNIDEMLINDIIESLIKNGEIKGTFTSNVYESELYEQNQINYLKGELKTNDYIDYANLKNIGINQNGKEYLKALSKKEMCFNDGVFLDEFFISLGLKNNFEITVSDNINKKTATNLSNIFFFDLKEEDTNALIESCQMQNLNCIFINNNLIQYELISDFIKNTQDDLKELASKEYNTFTNKVKESSNNNNNKTESNKTDTNKGYDDSDTETRGNKKKNKKKKKTKANTKTEKAETNAFNEVKCELTKPSIEIYKKNFTSLACFDDLNQKDETLNAIFEEKVLPELQTIYSNNIKEFIKTKSNQNNTNISDPKTLLNQINKLYHYLKLVNKHFIHLQSLSNDTAFQHSVKTISAFLCKKEVNSLLKDILLYQIIHMKLKLDTTKLNLYNERKVIINVIPDDDIRQIFTNLNDLCQNKNFTGFMNCVDDNAKIIAVNLYPFDKKAEKNQIELFVQELKSNIDKQNEIIGKLHFKDYLGFVCDCCSLALAKKNFYIKLSYELWVVGIYCDLLKEKVFELSELKDNVEKINVILNNKNEGKPEDVYGEKQNELVEIAKLLNGS